MLNCTAGQDLAVSSGPCRESDCTVSGIKFVEPLNADISHIADQELVHCTEDHRLEAGGDGAVQAVADDQREAMNANLTRDAVRLLEQWLAVAVHQLADIQPHAVMHHQSARRILAVGNIDAVNQVEDFS